MRIEPELDEVVNGPRGMLRGIEACLTSEMFGLGRCAFSGIDSLAALTRLVEVEAVRRGKSCVRSAPQSSTREKWMTVTVSSGVIFRP